MDSIGDSNVQTVRYYRETHKTVSIVYRPATMRSPVYYQITFKSLILCIHFKELFNNYIKGK